MKMEIEFMYLTLQMSLHLLFELLTPFCKLLVALKLTQVISNKIQSPHAHGSCG